VPDDSVKTDPGPADGARQIKLLLGRGAATGVQSSSRSGAVLARRRVTVKGVLALLIIIFIGGDAHAQVSYSIVGAGAQSCGKWLADRASNDYWTMGNWALGFLAGAAAFGGDLDPLHSIDSQAVAYWLDNYCHAHPTDHFVDALHEFIRRHPR
jgi:hypothetical protein